MPAHSGRLGEERRASMEGAGLRGAGGRGGGKVRSHTLRAIISDYMEAHPYAEPVVLL